MVADHEPAPGTCSLKDSVQRTAATRYAVNGGWELLCLGKLTALVRIQNMLPV